MDCKEHGKTVDPNCYKYIVTMNKASLKKIAGQYRDKLINPDDLYRKIVPIYERIYIYIYQTIR